MAEAIRWQAARSAIQVLRERELAIQRIERQAAEAWASGACDSWRKGCDERIANVARVVNGPLLESLAHESGHQDRRCVEIFREGA